jgi:hypothetical protein
MIGAKLRHRTDHPYIHSCCKSNLTSRASRCSDSDVMFGGRRLVLCKCPGYEQVPNLAEGDTVAT